MIAAGHATGRISWTLIVLFFLMVPVLLEGERNLTERVHRRRKNDLQTQRNLDHGASGIFVYLARCLYVSRTYIAYTLTSVDVFSFYDTRDVN
jgi:hypothetical protein